MWFGQVEIVDPMDQGAMKFGEKSLGLSEASRRESLAFTLEPQLLRAAPKTSGFEWLVQALERFTC